MERKLRLSGLTCTHCEETIKKELPVDFQTSEFLMEHGFVDLIVHRRDLKNKLAELLTYFAGWVS